MKGQSERKREKGGERFAESWLQLRTDPAPSTEAADDRNGADDRARSDRRILR